METYYINENLRFEANYWNRGRQSWGHEARAIYQGREVAKARITYYNRTWEAYTYQSVMKKLIGILDDEKSIPLKDRIEASRKIELGDQRDMKKLRSIGAIASLGSILSKTPEEANNFKKKIIGSIPGIELPGDFESLPEEEKSRRLDGAINIITK